MSSSLPGKSQAVAESYIGKQIRELRLLKWQYLAHKRKQFRYVNPLAGLIFTLSKKYYETDSCKFVIPWDLTSLCDRGQYYYDLYENEERQLVRKFVRPDDRVLELGGCIGVVSCVTNRKLLDDPKIHVVLEPNPQLCPYIKKNRQLNGCDFNIEQCVISDATDQKFCVDEKITGGSVARATGKELTVKSCRLTELENSYGKFNVLIMDIQGGEVELLELEESALGHFRLIVVEMHPSIVGEQPVEKCRQILRRLGFKLQERISTVEAWQK